MLDIVIVNWNSGNLLSNCIRALQNSSIKEINIYIVDNDSNDNSLSQVGKNTGNLHIIKSEVNMGFSKACNLGANKGSSPYLLFLNPDTEVFAETIEQSINFLINNQQIGILGVKQINDKGQTLKSCSRFLKLRNCFFSVTGLYKILPSVFKPATIMTDWDHESSRTVDQVMGAFMLMKREDFKKAGGFDEQYFVYYEDMDLAKKMLQMNKISYYNCDITLFHKGCGTTDKIPVKRLIYFTTSKLKYARKHFCKGNYYLLAFLTFFIEPVTRSINLIFTGNVKQIGNTVRVYKKVYRLL